jgi:serine/threonine-protein kinase
VVSRPAARTGSKLVSADAARLLQQFRTPRKITDAILALGLATGRDPERLLDAAFPAIRRLAAARLLVRPGSEEALPIRLSLDPGSMADDWEVLSCVQVLDDTEVYRARRRGLVAALKIARPRARRSARRALRREAGILARLNGGVNPRLLARGESGGRPYLAIEWFDGALPTAVATGLRQRETAAARAGLLALCRAILDAYAHLHAQQVIHSDVHARNLLVGPDQSIRILDYGAARLAGDEALGRADRVGVGGFFEPEYAGARLAGQTPPPSSFAGEQYALAALLYHLVTGQHYLDLSPERGTAYRQIAEEPPLPFSSRATRPWPELESVLGRALSKDPRARFASVSEFARSLPGAGPDVGRDRMRAVVSPVAGDRRLRRLLREVRQRAADSRLLTRGLTVPPTCSVHSGAAGLAHALYRIAAIQGGPAVLATADAWSIRAVRDRSQGGAFYSPDAGLTPENVGPVGLYHSPTGVHCVQALISHALGDVASLAESLQGFCTAARVPGGGRDLFLGRAGVLLGATLLLEAVRTAGPTINAAPLRRLADELQARLWTEVRALAPIPDRRDRGYLGIAHGWAGWLYAILRWGAVTRAPLPSDLAVRLDELARCAQPHRRGLRWPVRWTGTPNGRPRFVSGWCNGSAGFVHLWLLAHRAFRDERYLGLTERAAWHVWEDDDRHPVLCCGAAGRSYALLAFYKHTGERRWLRRARVLAERAAGAVTAPAFPWSSLYRGEVGVAVLAADLASPEASAMPVFEGEGWPGISAT